MTIHPWLQIDPEEAVRMIALKLSDAVYKTLSRRGCVVAVSGGIDSAVCAALSVHSLGGKKVFSLLLPERDSSPASIEQGKALCRALDIAYETCDITPVLESVGCYRLRDEAIRSVFPDYGAGWKNKIRISPRHKQGIADE